MEVFELRGPKLAGPQAGEWEQLCVLPASHVVVPPVVRTVLYVSDGKEKECFQKLADHEGNGLINVVAYARARWPNSRRNDRSREKHVRFVFFDWTKATFCNKLLLP